MTAERIQKGLALAVGLFVLYTAATGPFEGLIQRALFLALVTALGFALYPLGKGTPWRPVGLAIDMALMAATARSSAPTGTSPSRTSMEPPRPHTAVKMRSTSSALA